MFLVWFNHHYSNIHYFGFFRLLPYLACYDRGSSNIVNDYQYMSNRCDTKYFLYFIDA